MAVRALREKIIPLRVDQPEQVFRLDDQGTGQLDVADGELVALGDIDGDVDVGLVRRNRHLGRVDREIDVTVIEVERTQRFEVARQLLFRILVVLGEPAQPVRRAEVEQLEDLFVGKSLVADDVDLLDARRFAFDDGERDLDGLVVDVDHFVVDAHAVLTVGVVLALEFLQDLVELGLVEDLALGETDLLQALDEIIGLDRLVALEGEVGDGFALDHDHHEDVTVALEADVLEETGLEQGAYGVAAAGVVDGVADADRKVVEDRTRRDAFESLDTDVVDDE